MHMKSFSLDLARSLAALNILSEIGLQMQVLELGDFRIGVCHGHQVCIWSG